MEFTRDVNRSVQVQPRRLTSPTYVIPVFVEGKNESDLGKDSRIFQNQRIVTVKQVIHQSKTIQFNLRKLYDSPDFS